MGSGIARNHLSGLSGLPRCPCGRYAEGATRHTSGLVAQEKFRLTLRSALRLRLCPRTTGKLIGRSIHALLLPGSPSTSIIPTHLLILPHQPPGFSS